MRVATADGAESSVECELAAGKLDTSATEEPDSRGMEKTDAEPELSTSGAEDATGWAVSVADATLTGVEIADATEGAADREAWEDARAPKELVPRA